MKKRYLLAGAGVATALAFGAVQAQAVECASCDWLADEIEGTGIVPPFATQLLRDTGDDVCTVGHARLDNRVRRPNSGTYVQPVADACGMAGVGATAVRALEIVNREVCEFDCDAGGTVDDAVGLVLSTWYDVKDKLP